MAANAFFSTVGTPNLKDPQDSDEVHRCDLDLLSKINQVVSLIPQTGLNNLPVIVPLNAPPSGNITYTVPKGPGIFTVYIPASNLVASVAGSYSLTLRGTGATSVMIPLSLPGDTISSGNLLFDIYVDSNGNVTSKEWTIAGSNTNGNYIKFADGTMECWGAKSYNSVVSRYTNITLNLPAAYLSVYNFIATAWLFNDVTVSSVINWCRPTSLNTIYFQETALDAVNLDTSAKIVYWHAIGTWK